MPKTIWIFDELAWIADDDAQMAVECVRLGWVDDPERNFDVPFCRCLKSHLCNGNEVLAGFRVRRGIEEAGKSQGQCGLRGRREGLLGFFKFAFDGYNFCAQRFGGGSDLEGANLIG